MLKLALAVGFLSVFGFVAIVIVTLLIKYLSVDNKKREDEDKTKTPTV